MKKYFNKTSLVLIFSVIFQALIFPSLDPVKANMESDPIVDGVQRINANNLTWTPISKENPLGGADDFNAIFFDKFAHFNEIGRAHV